MSFKLERSKTKTTPYILIDEEKGYMLFEGECYLEDIIGFFKEINEWLQKYLVSGFTTFTFDCALEYFNSSTSKQIYNILRLIDASCSPGKKVIVNWIVANEDDDMLIENGEDYRDEMENLEFNIIIKN